MPTQKVDTAHQEDTDNIEQVGGTQSSRFGGQTTNLNYSQRTLMAAQGTISAQVSAAGFSTATTGAETTLVTFSLPANTLDVAGRGVILTYWGAATFASGTAVVKAYFGSVGTTVGTLATTNPFWGQIQIYKTAASVQVGVHTSTVSTTAQTPVNLSQTETDTSAIVVKVTGNQSAVASAISIYGFILEGMN